MIFLIVCYWPITSLPQFGPCPQLAEPDMTVRTGSATQSGGRQPTFVAARCLLLDHLVGRGQQRFRDGEAEGLGRLHVDEEFDFRDLLDRQVGGHSRPV